MKIQNICTLPVCSETSMIVAEAPVQTRGGGSTVHIKMMGLEESSTVPVCSETSMIIAENFVPHANDAEAVLRPASMMIEHVGALSA